MTTSPAMPPWMISLACLGLVSVPASAATLVSLPDVQASSALGQLGLVGMCLILFRHRSRSRRRYAVVGVPGPARKPCRPAEIFPTQP
jgi:hypothetical protein